MIASFSVSPHRNSGAFLLLSPAHLVLDARFGGDIPRRGAGHAVLGLLAGEAVGELGGAAGDGDASDEEQR